MINFLPRFSPGEGNMINLKKSARKSNRLLKALTGLKREESEIPQGIPDSVVCWFDNGFQGVATDFPDLILAACGLWNYHLREA